MRRDLFDDLVVVEKEIEEITNKLKEFDKHGFDKNLIDDEGFPRSDLNFENLKQYKLLKQRQNS